MPAKPNKSNALFSPVANSEKSLGFFEPYSAEKDISFLPKVNGKRVYQWGIDLCRDCISTIKTILDGLRTQSGTKTFDTFFNERYTAIRNNCIKPLFLHPASDFDTKQQLDVSIRSVAWGQVVSEIDQKNEGFNYNVKLRHEVNCSGVKEIFWARYCHLSKAKSLVKKNDYISPGWGIASGLTLAGTGPHLHFEVHTTSDIPGVNWTNANEFPVVNLFSYFLNGSNGVLKDAAKEYFEKGPATPNTNFFNTNENFQIGALKEIRFGTNDYSIDASTAKCDIVPVSGNATNIAGYDNYKNIIKNQIVSIISPTFIAKITDVPFAPRLPNESPKISKHYVNPVAYIQEVARRLNNLEYRQN